MTIEYNIISVNQNTCDSSLINENDEHDPSKEKYKKRREYLNNIFIPKLNNSYDVIIFDAVTKNDFFVKNNLIYFDNFYFKIQNDWNYNQPCSTGQISIVLSNYLLWKKCIKENKIIIICEDDIEFLNQENIDYTANCVKIFSEKYKNFNNLLYLQSYCPWRNAHKTYDLSQSRMENDFYILDKKFHDLSGAACYAITPACSMKLIEYIKIHGIYPLDQMTIKMLINGVFNVLIPKQFLKNAYINKDVQ